MEPIWTFHAIGEIIFGPGAVQRLEPLARQRNLTRALLVTDRALVSLGLADRVRAPLQAAGVFVDIFDGGEPEPTLTTVTACAERLRAGDYDAVISLGGGSNTDLAKAAAVVARYGGSPRAYGGEARVPGPIMPLIAVSTTAGTGSEVSSAAVLKDPEANAKFSILSNFIRPIVAVYDPELTLSCPPRLTAASGMDALTHAIEAYTNIEYHKRTPPPEGSTIYQGKGPMTDLMALRAIELIAAHLERVVHHGDDLEARAQVHLGSLLAGLAFSNAGVGLVHALEYPLGSLAHRPHGEGNALLLPYVMEFNLPACPAAFAEIAQAMGEDVQGLPQAEAAARAVEAVRRLERAVGVPMRLSEVGITADQIDFMAETAFRVKRLMYINPQPVTLEDLKAILHRAL